MNFNEICELAESTRDEVYGLRVGTCPRWGGDAVAFVSDIKHTGPKVKVETEHKKFKREKAENIAVYRAAFEKDEEFSFDDAVHTDSVAQHRAEMAWVAMGVKSGMLEPIEESDFLDEN